MTINSTTRKAGPFIGNGSAAAFPFAFKVFEAADVEVVRLNQSTNVETVLVLSSDYTVTLNADQNSNPGGTVTLSAGALASGFTLTITSDLANLQPTDLTNQGGFYPEVINDSLDRSTIQIQQLQEQIDRSLKVSVSTTADVTLPPPSANDLIGWDATGSNLENIDPGTLASIVAYATAYADTFTGDGTTTDWVLTRDPGNIFNLDVSINGVTQVPVTDYTINGTTFTTTTAAPDNAEILVKYREALPNTSGDSQDFRYLPAGSGAVPTTVQAKLRETVSVKDFGAVGDGVTDDTAAIQAAIDYAWAQKIQDSSSGIFDTWVPTIYFPNAKYKLDSSLTTYESLVIDGGFSQIFCPPTGYALQPDGANANGWRWNIKNLSFIGNNAIQISTNNLDGGGVNLQRLGFFGCDTAIDLSAQSSWVDIKDTIWYQCKKIVVNNACDQLSIEGGWMKQATMEANEDCSIINKGKLILKDVIGVPSSTGGFSETAWINNIRDAVVASNGGRTGYVQVNKFRAGGETGSKTLINNYAVAQTGGGYTPTVVIVKNSDVYSVDGTGTNKGIVRLFAMPNHLEMEGNTGFSDTQAVYLAASNTVATDIAAAKTGISVYLNNEKKTRWQDIQDPANNPQDEFYEIQAFRKLITHTALSWVSELSEDGYSHVTTSTSAPTVITAPKALKGASFTVFRDAVGVVTRVSPANGDQIRGTSAAAPGPGHRLIIDTNNVGITFKCFVDGFWEISETINTTFGSADYTLE